MLLCGKRFLGVDDEGLSAMPRRSHFKLIIAAADLPTSPPVIIRRVNRRQVF